MHTIEDFNMLNISLCSMGIFGLLKNQREDVREEVREDVREFELLELNMMTLLSCMYLFRLLYMFWY